MRHGWARRPGHAGSAEGTDDAMPEMIGNTTFDARVALPLTAGLAIEARGENLTDARVETAITGNGIVERAAPRTLWIGVSYRPR